MDSARRKNAMSAMVAALVVLGVLAVLTIVLVLAAGRSVPASRSAPAKSYEEAVTMAAALKARDDSSVMRPTIVMDHGSQAATTVVLFHGYTNNPEQFGELGRRFYDAGYNVLIPRMPEHGERDLLTRDLSKISPARIVDATNEAVDIAAGLGKTVEVIGLSGGGVMAALAARDRDEVSRAVIISPLFGVKLLPNGIVRPITGWSRILPDLFMWWDPRLKENHKPPDAYPRYSLKSMSAFFDVAYDIARRKPARSGQLEYLALVTNAADDSVSGPVAKTAVSRSLAPLADKYVQYEFPRERRYAHDLIDPDGLNKAHIDEIYAALAPYVGLETSTTP